MELDKRTPEIIAVYFASPTRNRHFLRDISAGSLSAASYAKVCDNLRAWLSKLCVLSTGERVVAERSWYHDVAPAQSPLTGSWQRHEIGRGDWATTGRLGDGSAHDDELAGNGRAGDGEPNQVDPGRDPGAPAVGSIPSLGMTPRWAVSGDECPDQPAADVAD